MWRCENCNVRFVVARVMLQYKVCDAPCDVTASSLWCPVWRSNIIIYNYYNIFFIDFPISPLGNDLPLLREHYLGSVSFVKIFVIGFAYLFVLSPQKSRMMLDSAWSVLSCKIHSGPDCGWVQGWRARCPPCYCGVGRVPPQSHSPRESHTAVRKRRCFFLPFRSTYLLCKPDGGSQISSGCLTDPPIAHDKHRAVEGSGWVARLPLGGCGRKRSSTNASCCWYVPGVVFTGFRRQDVVDEKLWQQF